jgi:hypothetical protein
MVAGGTLFFHAKYAQIVTQDLRPAKFYRQAIKLFETDLTGTEVRVQFGRAAKN